MAGVLVDISFLLCKSVFLSLNGILVKFSNMNEGGVTFIFESIEKMFFHS